MANNKDVIKISTLIGAGCVCDGDFTAKGSARIDGTINGNVDIEGALILGVGAVIVGNVKASMVQIGGEVQGNVDAKDKAELTSTAKVIGDLTTNVLVVDESAVLQGVINMNQDPGEKKTKTAAYRRALKNNKRSAAAAVAEALKEVSIEELETSSDSEV